MLQTDRASLWQALGTGEAERSLWGIRHGICLNELVSGSILGGHLDELRGRSVLLAVKDQLTAALALIELDGIVRRLVLCPPDLPVEHISSVVVNSDTDAVVCDKDTPADPALGVGCFLTCGPIIAPTTRRPTRDHETQWILLTSGTTGTPKLVVHTLSTLAAPIKLGSALGIPAVWSTFYDIRRYGGLQIFLRAVLGGGSMVLSSAAEATGEFLARAGAHGVTHISGTPSHWRRALMSPAINRIAPRYVRLSGEIADQAILDQLRGIFPRAGVSHAFASTEAGVAFEVPDGFSGFPASLIGRAGAEVEMKVDEDTLRIRSARTALRYLGSPGKPLADEDGFVNTGDIVEMREGRYHFIGRRDGVINVGGQKVHPEEVEAVINRHPKVQISLVKARRNPITGTVVTADIVVKADEAVNVCVDAEPIKAEIFEACRRVLAPHQVPATIRFVGSLEIGATGKLARLGS
jgi:acyl-CoA synthetase (AMP-forming)/AMP-acid ligase II